MGEIDLVMRDHAMLVFVEVRYRTDYGFGSPCETVDQRKQRKLYRSAQHFLLRHKQYNNLPCRFDVLGISTSQGREQYEWLQNAFS